MARSGIAALKLLQWLLRALQLIASVLILGIYSYFLATMAKAHITIPPPVKAIEGISAVATLYSLLGVLFVCCCAGHAGTSFVAMVLDGGLAGAFVYVAIANKDGAGSCSGASVGTVYGTGDAGARPSGGEDDVIANIGTPTFGTACRLEMVVLIASCVGALFFLLSIPLEIKMNRSRHRASRPLRNADGEYINKSEPFYPSHAPPPQRRDRSNFLGGFRRRRSTQHPQAAFTNPDALPGHQQPSDMVTTRHVAEWGEVASLHDSDRLYFNDGNDPHRDSDVNLGQGVQGVKFTSTTAPRPAAATVEEGDLGEREFEQSASWKEQDPSNGIGTKRGWGKRSESREARVERLTNF